MLCLPLPTLKPSAQVTKFLLMPVTQDLPREQFLLPAWDLVNITGSPVLPSNTAPLESLEHFSSHPAVHRGRSHVPGEGSEEQQRCCIILLIPASICSAEASSWEAARGNKWVCWIGHHRFPLQVQGQSRYPSSHG